MVTAEHRMQIKEEIWPRRVLEEDSQRWLSSPISLKKFILKEKMLRSFLWKGTENEKSFLPVSWTKVCVPKEEGGSV